MNDLDRIRQLAGLSVSKKLNEGVSHCTSMKEGIELGNENDGQEAYYIIDSSSKGIKAGPYQSRNEATRAAQSFSQFNPQQHTIDIGVDDNGVLVDNAPFEEGIELGDENDVQEAYYIIDTRTKAIKAGPYQSSSEAMMAAKGAPGFNPQQYTIDIGVDDGGILVNNAPFEEDIENGYNDQYNVDGEDFFPSGADGAVVHASGASGAHQGDNPEQKFMQVAEVHKELVYGYRSYLREGEKEHEENRDAAQRELDRRESEGEDMSGHHVDPKTYKIVKTKQK